MDEINYNEKYGGKYWEDRNNEWVKSCWDDQDHSHRIQLINILKKLDFNSLLEVGCGPAPNLALIKKEFPKIKLAGTDINSKAIDFSKKKLPSIYFKKEEVESISYNDKEFDLILSDGLLIYINKDNIVKVKNELLRVAKKYIVLVEYQNKDDDELGNKDSGHWKRDYIKLFKNHKVKLYKIKNWPDKNWTKYGYIIVIEIKECMPYMCDNDINVFNNILKKKKPKTCLEFGGGGSSVYFPKKHNFIEKWFVVEDDYYWFNFVKKRACSKVKLFSECPLEYKYDLIFIDGGNRGDNMKKAKNLLNENGICVLHDSGRKEYKEFFKVFKHNKKLTDGNQVGHGLHIFWD